MTREQQDAERALVQAQNNYLFAYNWKWDIRRGWTHRALSPNQFVNLRDAMHLTASNKLLAAYPNRQVS